MGSGDSVVRAGIGGRWSLRRRSYEGEAGDVDVGQDGVEPATTQYETLPCYGWRVQVMN